LAEISYVMNNRPLTTLTENETDLIPLTLSRFLRDLPVKGLPEMEAISAEDLQEAHRKISDLKGALKGRFRKVYLGILIQKKTKKLIDEVKVGDDVLVGADNKKRFQWPLGKILEIIPGKDDKVRVARVKTATGILLRPVQRLYSL